MIEQNNGKLFLPFFTVLISLITFCGCSYLPNSENSTPQSNKFEWTGQWQVDDPSSGQKETFILTPEGKLLLLPKAASDSPIAYNIPIRKISNSTTLPPNTKVVAIEDAFENQANKGKQSEAKNTISFINKAQSFYYIENNKFATDMEQLALGLPPETENYLYRIVPQNGQPQSVISTAQAKLPDLKSYTGAVFFVPGNDGGKVVSIICETDQPSSTPPSLPAPSSSNNPEEIQCPSGSRKI